MVHNKQCAKIEDRDERTNCLNQVPTPQEVEQGQAAYDACLRDAGKNSNAVRQCWDMGDEGGN